MLESELEKKLYSKGLRYINSIYHGKGDIAEDYVKDNTIEILEYAADDIPSSIISQIFKENKEIIVKAIKEAHDNL